MKKKVETPLKTIGENPNLIPGIYNYCDRWCERCQFTQRCANFELNGEFFSDEDALDISNQAFWDQLAKVFQMTLQMVKEMAEQQGIDLDAIDYEAIERNHEEFLDRAASDECARVSKDYITLVTDWFDNAKYIFNEKTAELELSAELELPNCDPVADAEDINDLVEVIRWYQHQIHVKLMRAISGRLEDAFAPPSDLPKDSDGSAKVALIGIDRSIAAWGKLLTYFPEKEDSLFKILVLLERLRKKTEASFPEARSFVRPGFDEM